MSRPVYNVIDLELNSWPSGHVSEIVEIGIAELDENFNLLRSVRKFVKPKSGMLTTSTAELTGITFSDVMSALPLRHVLGQLLREGFFRNRVLVSWGLDHEMIRAECQSFQPEDAGTINLQQLYSIMTLKSPTRKTSLSNASTMCSIPFAGTAHRAEDDAIQTAKIFKFVMERLYNGPLR